MSLCNLLKEIINFKESLIFMKNEVVCPFNKMKSELFIDILTFINYFLSETVAVKLRFQILESLR